MADFFAALPWPVPVFVVAMLTGVFLFCLLVIVNEVRDVFARRRHRDRIVGRLRSKRQRAERELRRDVARWQLPRHSGQPSCSCNSRAVDDPNDLEHGQ